MNLKPVWLESNQAFFLLKKNKTKTVLIAQVNSQTPASYGLKFAFLDMCMVCVFFHRESSSISLQLLSLADPRVNLLTNGGLEISNISHDDEGIYACSIQNSNVSINAELEVLSE